LTARMHAGLRGEGGARADLNTASRLNRCPPGAQK
jgi:hypothetical protein